MLSFHYKSPKESGNTEKQLPEYIVNLFTELNELEVKLYKLQKFTRTAAFVALSHEDKQDLIKQKKVMQKYQQQLLIRLRANLASIE